MKRLPLSVIFALLAGCEVRLINGPPIGLDAGADASAANDLGSPATDVPPANDLAAVDVPSVDAPANVDLPASPDAPPPADVPPTACRSDRECSKAGAVCDPMSMTCVECVRDGDCLDPGTGCVANRCVVATRCTSSRMCPGQVCDTTAGRCVDCIDDRDCAAGLRCSVARSCGAELCTPGAATCPTTGSRAVCNADGHSRTVTPCASPPGGTATCTGSGICTVACAAGLFDCDGRTDNGCESATACAGRILRGFGGPADIGTADHCVHPNDDGSYAGPSGAGAAVPIDITSAFPGGLTFFGANYRSMYVNTNGNISFRGGLGTFTPAPFPVASQPIIAPWWADVDTRGGGQPSNNSICFALQPGRIVVTWLNVGYFSSHNDRLNTFQLVLIDRSAVTPGDFDVEFRYDRCEWTTGDASGGMGGMGGTPAQVGFDAGDRMNYVTLPMSRTAAILDVCRSTNVPGGQPGVWRFNVRGGVVPVRDGG